MNIISFSLTHVLEKIPIQSKHFSFGALPYYLKSLFSLGIRACHEDVLKRRTVLELETEQDRLKRRLKGRMAKWDQLENGLLDLISRAHELLEEAFAQNINQLNGERVSLLNEEPVPAIHSVVLKIDFSYFIAHLLTNWFTFGLYGFYKQQRLNEKIERLKNENLQIREQCENFYTKNKDEHFRESLQTAHTVFTCVKENEKMRTVNEVDLPQFPKITKESDTLRTQQARLNEQLRTLTTELEIQKKNEHENHHSIEKIKNEITVLKSAYSQGETDINQFNQDIANIESQTAVLREKANNLCFLQLQLDSLEKDLALCKMTKDLQKQVGDIPSKYQRIKGDIDLPGDAIVQENHAAIIKEAKSGAQIVEAYFTHLAKKKSNRSHVYRLVAFDLIRASPLVSFCNGLYILQLKQGINLSPSKPIRVQGKNKEGQPYLKDFPTNYDEFTTPIFIESDSIKWILNRLTQDERETLRASLKNEEFKLTRSIQVLTEEKRQLICLAHQLICDVGRAFQLKLG